MKVTFVLPGYPWRPVGGFKVVYEYANQLALRGHRVTVLHPRRICRRSSLSLSDWLGTQVRSIGKRLLKPTLAWRPLDARVEILYVPEPAARYVPDADAVFATAWMTAEYVLQYPVSKGRKFYLVQDFDPWLAPKDQLEASWRLPLKKVTVSRWLYNKVRASRAPEEDTVNIPNGINHHSFRLTRSIAQRPKRVSMLYSSSSYKAPQDGLRALEMARTRHQDLEVVIFGPGRRRPARLPGWAVYKGNVPEEELVETYNSSRIYLCSSLAEGFALPPAEAMACGCAVVSTDCGGIREFAIDEVNALLSPPRDAAALAANIIRLLNDDDLCQLIAKAGYEQIQQFTWERSAGLLEEFIAANLASAVSRTELGI